MYGRGDQVDFQLIFDASSRSDMSESVRYRGMDHLCHVITAGISKVSRVSCEVRIRGSMKVQYL
jgi:hypothetical protein